MAILFLSRFSGTPLAGDGLVAPGEVDGWEQTTGGRAASLAPSSEERECMEMAKLMLLSNDSFLAWFLEGSHG